MNDFERKLSQQPFRTPPPELRDAIFGAPENVIEPARWTWRDWFWPSPQAWAALAALWLVFAALSWRENSAAPASASSVHPLPASPTPLAFHINRNFNRVLESLN